jgi:DnaK suppressor protein
VESVSIETNPRIEKLEQQRQETLQELEHLRIELRNLAEPSADEADVDAYEREKIWALVQTMQRKLKSLEQAIELTRSGAYGVCQSCGDRIDPARLDILPTATLCLKCQQEFERRNKRHRY